MGGYVACEHAGCGISKNASKIGRRLLDAAVALTLLVIDEGVDGAGV